MPVEAPARHFEAPGPGSWSLDAGHCEGPRSRWMTEWAEELYQEGFRAGFEKTGATLDTIELRHVHGVPYTAVRPLGAPPHATKPPPRFIFTVLTRLHPEFRRRNRRAAEVLTTRPWRQEVRRFHDRWLPETVEWLEEVQSQDVASLTDSELAQHVQELRTLGREILRDHFHTSSMTMVPVGLFLQHATEQTGCTVREALACLDGSSPLSLEPIEALDRVAEDIRADAALRELLRRESNADTTLTTLAEQSDAAATWLRRIGQRIITNHDVSGRRGVDAPELLLATLRKHLDKPKKAADHRADADEAAAKLRERTTASAREGFDELLCDARDAHPLRDGRSIVDFWGMGLARRGLLEVGERLTATGRLEHREHATDLTTEEIAIILEGGDTGPTRSECAELGRWKEEVELAELPEWLGAPPAEPPPAEWLPRPLGRIAGALGIYIQASFAEADVTPNATIVQGVGASGGRYVGTARLVTSPDGFSRVQDGDVLVTRITTPLFNVLLPLLGGVVTDRGGILSHPAIVAREYGIPGVVGSRDATLRIPDGAKVEIDGDAGTVKVLA